MDKCPKCYRPLPPHAAQCVWSDCHAYFDQTALIWYQRDQIKARKDMWEADRRRDEEAKALKKAARAAKQTAGDDGDGEAAAEGE